MNTDQTDDYMHITVSNENNHDLGQRSILINRIQGVKFCSNEISTGKYNVWTFIPKFIFEQFRKYANMFFLAVALLQQIPGVSPTGRFTTVVPLTIILFVSAVKEIIEDFKRHTADKTTNRTKTLVLRDCHWIEVPWMHVKVGDVVKVVNNGGIPADLLLLSSSEPMGMCYIETSNLDGETNLKLRQGLKVTAEYLTAETLETVGWRVDCEKPNRNLDEFVGTLWLSDGNAHPIGPNQLVLRGATLKNTHWIFGAVLYTGKETKVMLNSAAAPLKRSSVDKQTNKYILLLLLLLAFLTLFTVIANAVWAFYKDNTEWYLGDTRVTAASVGFMVMTAFIMFHTIIPISLQVSLEVVRFIQAFFINWDQEMYDADSDTAAMARTSNLNEDLGKVKHIFSDKTGTLTRNVMEFKRCSIAGQAFGTEYGDLSAIDDDRLLKRIKLKDDDVHFFFTTLAVCHTVVPEVVTTEMGEQVIRYQASSPDESALVQASSRLGYVFSERTPDTITVVVQGQKQTFKVLHVLEFTSSRKRMSVIVKDPAGRLLLMTKGADSVIYERLSSDSKYTRETFEHMEEFAEAGLRTLCIAYSVLESDFYEQWKSAYHEASISLENRDAKLEAVAEQIEQNLMLMGATAIEDKLQELVPETIADLLSAGISIWVLTGDKQETAINIGFSCKLLTPEQSQFILDATSPEEMEIQLKDARENFTGETKALIINGKTVDFALTPECRKDFLEIAMSCASVICCRVSPWQKAEVVRLVRSESSGVTLAIGDGVNDVGMIQAAHIGVGISGKEGMQAASASDYAIGQFRFLKRLLFLHGTWNYYRITTVILYSFYKNICLFLILFWFTFASGFSGQILFERWSMALYNVAFSALPPLAIGLFDRVCSEAYCMKHPSIYCGVQEVYPFNLAAFLRWLSNAVFHSLILFLVPAAAFHTDVVYGNGQTASLLVLGSSVYTFVVVTVCLKAGMEHNAWTVFSHVAIWGSIISWFLFLAVYPEVYPTLPLAAEMVGMNAAVYGCPIFWLCLLLVPPLTLTLDFAKKVWTRPHWETIVLEDLGRLPFGTRIGTRVRFSHLFRFHRRKPQGANELSIEERPNTGYAFSQDENRSVSQTQVVRSADSSRPKPKGD